MRTVIDRPYNQKCIHTLFGLCSPSATASIIRSEEPSRIQKSRRCRAFHPDEQWRSAIAADGDESIYRFVQGQLSLLTNQFSFFKSVSSVLQHPLKRRGRERPDLVRRRPMLFVFLLFPVERKPVCCTNARFQTLRNACRSSCYSFRCINSPGLSVGEVSHRGSAAEGRWQCGYVRCHATDGGWQARLFRNLDQ